MFIFNQHHKQVFNTPNPHHLGAEKVIYNLQNILPSCLQSTSKIMPKSKIYIHPSPPICIPPSHV